jgi:two-component system, chemotaxis family, response regulator Rcp1
MGSFSFRVRHVLLIEDNRADAHLVKEALEEVERSHQLHVSHDGEDALDFVCRRNQHIKSLDLT